VLREMPPKVEGSNRTLLFRNLDERVKANELAKFLSQFATVEKQPSTHTKHNQPGRFSLGSESHHSCA
jgi:hypothetical protein